MVHVVNEWWKQVRVDHLPIYIVCIVLHASSYHLRGKLYSGSTSVSHTEGPGFDSLLLHGIIFAFST
jgi:hypothetical protein